MKVVSQGTKASGLPQRYRSPSAPQGRVLLHFAIVDRHRVPSFGNSLARLSFSVGSADTLAMPNKTLYFIILVISALASGTLLKRSGEAPDGDKGLLGKPRLT